MYSAPAGRHLCVRVGKNAGMPRPMDPLVYLPRSLGRYGSPLYSHTLTHPHAIRRHVHDRAVLVALAVVGFSRLPVLVGHRRAIDPEPVFRPVPKATAATKGFDMSQNRNLLDLKLL